MKKIFLLFFILLLSSCFGEKPEKSAEKLLISDVSNENELIAIYNDNKETAKKIIDGEIKLDSDGQKYFLEGLDLCKKISETDFLNKSSKELFLKEVGIFNLYLDFNSGKLVSYDECLEGGELKSNCNFQKSDLLLASYFAGKTSLENTKKYLSELSEFYKDKELANSILLKIIEEKISGKNIDFTSCEKSFSLGYKGFFDEKK